MSHYIAAFSALAVGRTLDLLSTWHVTPTFQSEINQWMKRAGWKRVILINIVLSIVLPFSFGGQAAVVVATASALAAHRNYLLSPLIKVIGNGKYNCLVAEYYRSCSTARFATAVGVKLAIFVLLGVLLASVRVIDHAGRLWFLPAVAQGMIFYGLFVAAIEIVQRSGQRRVMASAHIDQSA